MPLQNDDSPAVHDRNRRPDFDRSEEVANSLLHAVGALLAVAGLILLALQATDNGRVGSLAAVLVYGMALILLFTFSALHHGLPLGRAKRLFLGLDHAGIYLLIAGTYTPFCLLALDRHNLLLGAIWTLAAVGIGLQATAFLRGWGRSYEKAAFLIYLAMGWLPILLIGRGVMGVLDGAGLLLLVGGGLAYSIGIVFYLWRSLRFSHAVWHTFVLAASAQHFFAVFYYVVPAPA